MHDRDIEPFSSMLHEVYALYPRANDLTPNQVAMFFRALRDHTIHAVRQGMDAHVKDPQRGRFPPLPADVIAQIVGHAANDQRPGAEEAWAIAISAADEAKTVVWTDEIAQAWGIAKGIAKNGDEVGARMAFKEAYTRLVGEARAAQRVTRWSASLGHDAEERDKAIERAQVAGLLPAPAAQADLQLLEGQPHASGGQPRGPHAAKRQRMPFDVQQRLEALRAKLVGATPAPAEEGGRVIGQFQPVPRSALPPGMREERR